MEIQKFLQKAVERRKEYCLENFDSDRILQDGSFANILDDELLNRFIGYLGCQAALTNNEEVCQTNISAYVDPYSDPLRFSNFFSGWWLEKIWDLGYETLIR